MGKKALPSSHDKGICAKLLYRLGIYNNVQVQRNNADRRKHILRGATSTSGSRSIIGNVVPFREPLNDADATTTFNNERTRSTTAGIQFSSEVTVVPIPSHHEYSNRIRKCLWSDGAEIQENAERNRIEFAAEGWDWHTVLEDDDMFVDANTGELVHPCWFVGGDSIIDDSSSGEEEQYLELEQPTLTRSQSCVVKLHDHSE
jgi:hypothetical protein